MGSMLQLRAKRLCPSNPVTMSLTRLWFEAGGPSDTHAAQTFSFKGIPRFGSGTVTPTPLLSVTARVRSAVTTPLCGSIHSQGNVGWMLGCGVVSALITSGRPLLKKCLKVHTYR